MSRHTPQTSDSAFEARSRQLFRETVEGLDMQVQSHLTQGRHAALQAAAAARGRPWMFMFRPRVWTPMAGLTAAVLLGAALWFGSPMIGNRALPSDSQPSLEDLDIVASSDEGSADPLEMLQNDLDFYDFADKAAMSGPAA